MAFAYTVIRWFHGGALAVAALAPLALVGALPERASAKPPARPNIVVIVTDDQAAPTLRPDTMPTVMGRIAGQGTSFSDAVVTTPLCCPSRASMLTGQYAHNNGVFRNDYRQLREKTSTLPAWLQRAGYRTILVGKYLNLYRKARGPEAEAAPGWDVWQTIQEPNTYYDYDLSVNGRVVDYGTSDSDYLTDVLSRRATRLARRSAARKRPFYLQLDEWAPHESRGRDTGPCATGYDAQPGPADETLFQGEPLPQPPSFNEEDVSDKPSFIQHQNQLEVGAVERNYRCALASLRAVDRGVERLYGALRQAGELDDTIVVFTSDNGYFYGEHRLRYKVDPYEEALRVPLLISVPPQLLGGANRPSEVDAPVASIDIAPTILALADARPCRERRKCRTMDGRSLVPLLRGQDVGWAQDRAVLVEYRGRFNDFVSCAYGGVRAGGQVYIEHTMAPNVTTGQCEPRLETEHYDLAADPFQLDNIAPAPPGSPAAAREQDLADRLATLRACAGIAGRDPGQVGRTYCE
jgi:N-acetylglucosamine-6-sulfatase